MKLDTESLKMLIENTPRREYQFALIQAYHTARCADALERLAHTLENNQISILEGDTIANAVERLVRK